MRYTFSETSNDFVLDTASIPETIQRIQHYITHYETLLSYTKKSVKRKKIQDELNWWKSELIDHEETLQSIS